MGKIKQTKGSPRKLAFSLFVSNYLTAPTSGLFLVFGEIVPVPPLTNNPKLQYLEFISSVIPLLLQNHHVKSLLLCHPLFFPVYRSFISF